MNRRRLVERARVLPWAGAFLLTPPVLLVPQAWARAWEGSAFLVYIFMVWLMLIVLAGVAAGRLAAVEVAAPPYAQKADDGTNGSAGSG
jgi:hypothetical protein